MPTLSPEQKLEIARRVHETFDRPKRWHQGGWGRDDDGDVIEFDGGFHVVDNDDVHHPPAFRLATPESPRCFCLGATIRIHTGSILWRDPSHTGEATETMCAVYTRLAGIDTGALEQDAPVSEPHLNGLIEWNDSDERSWEDIRDLTAAVLRHLDAQRWRSQPPKAAPPPASSLHAAPPCAASPGVRPAGAGQAGGAAREVPPRARRPCPSSRENAMLHRITGRALKCGPSAISAIAGVPTHEAAAVIRRLFDRPSVNGVHTDELAAALEEFGWAPDYALRHPKYRERRHARRDEVWDRIFADVPFDVRAVTLGTFLDPAPAGMWAISASNHFVAYADGFVADSGAWISRKPRPWRRADPDCDRVALRRVREAVRFIHVSRPNPAPEGS